MNRPLISGSLFLVLASFCLLKHMNAQNQPPNTSMPGQVLISVDDKLLLDAAGPAQRHSLKNIYLIGCNKANEISFGTGFLLIGGVIVTNAHVVDGCSGFPLAGVSTTNQTITFTNILRDTVRDLAILVPSAKLDGGYELAANDNTEPGTRVDTWGYPFGYNGTSPLLSVGYVSGYRSVEKDGKSVKHIVVNGAFNHGNSGGPLLVSPGSSVIGVVVLTFNFYPQRIKTIIDSMAATNFGVVYDVPQPDGTQKKVSEAQFTAAVLDEFYDKTQVDIGEAIAASELRGFITDHKAELPPALARGIEKTKGR
jgi:S1-C subfamily serine protease